MIAVDYKQAVRATSKPIWEPLNPLQKREILQTLENKIAADEGRTARNIILEKMQPGYYGYYNHGDPTNIHMSLESLRSADDALDTLYHEGRHAYQWDCIDNQSGFPKPILDQFHDGFVNYVSPEDNYEKYCNNFTEKDACSFAEQQCALLSMERDAYLKQDETADVEPIEILDENGLYSQAATNNPFFKNNSAAYYNPALAEWAKETCSWQPEKEAVKTLGGSSTTNKVYTNGEMYALTRNRYAEDRYLGSCNWNNLSSDQQANLAAAWQTETQWKDALDKNIGPGKEFDACVEGFFGASEDLRSCCPYEIQQFTPNYSVKNPSESTASLRQSAVEKAWERESDLVRDGLGTRDWSVAQQAELLDYGKVTGFEGSHMMNVHDYPEYQGNPDNIQLMPGVAHYEGVHEHNPRGVNPNGRFDENTGEVIPAIDDQIPEQPIIQLTDKYDPSQKEYHQSTPEMEQSGQRRHDDYYQSKENHPEKSQKIGFRADPEEGVIESQTQSPATTVTRDRDVASDYETQESSKSVAPVQESAEIASPQRETESEQAQNGFDWNTVRSGNDQSTSLSRGSDRSESETANKSLIGDERYSNTSPEPQQEKAPEQTQNGFDWGDVHSGNDQSSSSSRGVDRSESETADKSLNGNERYSDTTPVPQQEKAPEQAQNGFDWGNVRSGNDQSSDQSNTQSQGEKNGISM